MQKRAGIYPISRRGLLHMGGVTVGALYAPSVIAADRDSSKVLRIMQWTHFVPGYDDWFNNEFVVEWGKKNDTRVIVDNVGMTSLKSRAAAEIGRQRGHDICMFLSPPATYEDHVIDHGDIYSECVSRYGKPLDLALRSSFNPRTRKHFCFSDAYVPDPVNYRKDLWNDIGMSPDTWDDIRVGGRRIREKHGIPVGIGLARELDTNMAVRSMLASFGASIQDAEGRPSLRSQEALEALKFARALYNETMIEDVFSWDASSNNRFMLAGKGSLTLNAISITRTGENKKIPVADRISLSPPAAGPSGRLGIMHLMNAYVVWKFAQNIEGAERFLVDLAGASRDAFRASEFYNFPTYPQLIPDLKQLIAHDPKATPADKYTVFENVQDWTYSVDHPGYSNAATDEVFSKWLLPRMFAQAASGRLSPEDALDSYAGKIERIFDNWRERGKV